MSDGEGHPRTEGHVGALWGYCCGEGTVVLVGAVEVVGAVTIVVEEVEPGCDVGAEMGCDVGVVVTAGPLDGADEVVVTSDGPEETGPGTEVVGAVTTAVPPP